MAAAAAEEYHLSFDIGTRNMSYCLLCVRRSVPASNEKRKKSQVHEPDFGNMHIEMWGRIDLLAESNAKGYKVQIAKLVPTLVKCLYEKFGDRLATTTTTEEQQKIFYVDIEDQPLKSSKFGGSGSVTMKILSYVIFSFAETYNHVYPGSNIVCRTINGKKKFLVCDYFGVSAEKPLRAGKKKISSYVLTGSNDSSEDESEDEATMKAAAAKKDKADKKKTKKQIEAAKYRNRKWRSVEACKMILSRMVIEQENEDDKENARRWRDYFLFDCGKQDDDAESLTQAVYAAHEKFFVKLSKEKKEQEEQ